MKTYRTAHLSVDHLASSTYQVLQDMAFFYPIAIRLFEDGVLLELTEWDQLGVCAPERAPDLEELINWAQGEGLHMLMLSEQGETLEDLPVYGKGGY